MGAGVAGLWPAWKDRRQPEGEPSVCTAAEIASVAAREAMEDAAAVIGAAPPARRAVVLGTCFGEDFRAFAGLAQELADAIGFLGPCLAISTACSSSTNAIGFGRDLVRLGAADVVLAGGADVVTREIMAGFAALGVLAPGKCAPFSEPTGITLAEGAGFVLLARSSALPPEGRRK